MMPMLPAPLARTTTLSIEISRYVAEADPALLVEAALLSASATMPRESTPRVSTDPIFWTIICEVSACATPRLLSAVAKLEADIP
jgi:hypothetical protein